MVSRIPPRVDPAHVSASEDASPAAAPARPGPAAPGDVGPRHDPSPYPLSGIHRGVREHLMATPRGRLLLAAHEAANALSETDLVEIAKSEAGDKPSLKARALGWLGRKESPKELVQRVLEQQGEFADMDAGAVLEQLRHSRRVLDAVALSVDPSTLRRTNARLLREHAAGVQQEYSERVLSHLPEGVLDIIGLSLGRDDQSSLLTQALPVRAAHVFPAWTSADGRIKAGQAK